MLPILQFGMCWTYLKKIFSSTFTLSKSKNASHVYDGYDDKLYHNIED